MLNSFLLQALQAFLRANTWGEAKHIVTQYPDLLLEEVDDLLSELATAHREQGDEYNLQVVEGRRALLRRCREVGVEAAFNEIVQQRESDLEELNHILDLLARPAHTQSIQQRIAICRRGLELAHKDQYPELWASLHLELANNLSKNPQGNKAENLEESIEHFQQALEVFTSKEYPERWGLAQHNMAAAYLKRIRGERAANIEQAIHHFLQSLEIRTREAIPVDWAMTQNNLSAAYLNRIRGDRSENIERAIQYSDKAQEILSKEAFPEEWSEAQNNLAIGHAKRIRGDRAENIEQAIFHFQQTLETRTKHRSPDKWAMTQINLAVAYLDRIQGERAQNLETSIAHSKKGLEVFNRQSHPADWAIAQNHLGNAYQNRILGERADNLEQAIHHLQQALEVRTRKDFPEQWAETNNSLANAYRDRIRGDRAENLEQAIFHYRQSLEIFTRQSFPADWAMIQNNLANAFLNRIRGERAENLEMAIRHYSQALEMRTRKTYPEQWANTLNNLAIAYKDRVHGDRAENIDQAIHHHSRALEIYDRQTYPQKWATIQNNLGNAYLNRINGERAENLEMAIHHYSQALEVYTQQAYPVQWAMIQNNLAIAFSGRIQSDLDKNIDQAVYHYQQALKVLTPNSDPMKARNTAMLLGRLCLNTSKWKIAAETFVTAIEADRILFESALFQESKESELEEARNLYFLAAFAFAKTEKPHLAVESLEAGRARLLREALEQDRRDLEELRASGHGELLDRYREASSRYSNLLLQRETIRMASTETEATHPPVRLDDIEEALGEVSATIAAIRIIPGFQRFLRSLNAIELKSLAAKDPLVYLAATPAGGLALLVKPEAVTPIWLDRLTEKALMEQLQGPDNEPQMGGFLGVYDTWRRTITDEYASDEEISRASEAWNSAIDETTHWLWGVCMNKVIQKLKEEQTDQAVLIPGGLLGLLPLHAAWVEDSSTSTGRCYALDEICFTYAPSAHALMPAQDSESRQVKSILAVDNPDGTLEFASEEVAAAVDHFADENTVWLIGDAASSERVTEEITRYDVLHFSTHGLAGFTQPLDSFLLLAHDRPLYLREILRLRLNARLAVLSACETGIPGTRLPDEVVGLPTGFLQAGAAGVVGSLWAVNDASTMMLMARFYDFWLVEDLEPPEALRQAQVWLRDTTNKKKEAYFRHALEHYRDQHRMPDVTAREGLKHIRFADPDELRFAHPFFWAAFGFTGN